VKHGALTKVSNELANDSSPAATIVVGNGLTRSIARQLDVAFFGTGGGLAPPGLLSLSGIATVTVPGSPGAVDTGWQKGGAGAQQKPAGIACQLPLSVILQMAGDVAQRQAGARYQQSRVGNNALVRPCAQYALPH
jgi:hypothetical protein